MDVMFEIFNRIFVRFSSFSSWFFVVRVFVCVCVYVFSSSSSSFSSICIYLDVTYMLIARSDDLWSLAWVDVVDGFRDVCICTRYKNHRHRMDEYEMYGRYMFEILIWLKNIQIEIANDVLLKKIKPNEASQPNQALHDWSNERKTNAR